MKKKFTIGVLLVMSLVAGAQDTVYLYKGAAPGSENWNWSEKEFTVGTMKICMDVTKPSLIVYRPAHPNGTALIVAPGGAFHVLAIEHEGTAVAKWLNEKGVTCFVLKYRLVHDDPAHPENSIGNLMATKNYRKLDSINSPVVPLTLQDGLTAVKYVREHASQYKIDRGKIGFMGFSAGGTVTLSVVYNATEIDRPNFVAPIYAYAAGAIGSTVPKEKTPIFIAAATDDDLGLAPQSVQLYEKWVAAGQPAEVHMYERGKHGFGMNKQNLPVDRWIERFSDWLQVHGLLGK